MKLVSYSQNLEDIVLYKALVDVKYGTYIDVGAGHPEKSSVTKLFYDLGWSGINVEPNSTYFYELQQHRPRDINVQVLVSNDSKQTKYFSATSAELSTADERIWKEYLAMGVSGATKYLKTERLDAIVRRANLQGDIHFLKIDCEGMEVPVLQSMDFERFRPWIILIECIDPITKLESSVGPHTLLSEYGYILVYEDGLNKFYLSKSKNHLVERFRYPPNILDDFIKQSEVSLYNRINIEQNKVVELTLKNRVLEIERKANSELLRITNSVVANQANKIMALESRFEVNPLEEIKMLHGHLKNLEEQLHHLRLENHAIKNSTIWVSTTFLREIIQKMKLVWKNLYCLLSVESRENLIKSLRFRIGNRFPAFRSYMRESNLIFIRILRFIFTIQQNSSKDTHHLESVMIMGQRVITQEEWNEAVKNHTPRALSIRDLELAIKSKAPIDSHNSRENVYSATVIISLFNSGEYLPLLLTNLLEQTVFHECEICILSISPSAKERELLFDFSSNFTNVKLQILEQRIGIYAAWNQMIHHSTAPFITNMNADDFRSPDSIQLQIEYLTRNTWVDVVYQDFFYTRNHGLDWSSIAQIHARSNLSTVSLYSLVAKGINPPHNAPMWRRSLHDSVGYFLDTLESAGDIEFWIRCKLQGVVFLKMREVHVSYFINPTGMSTRFDTPGRTESTNLIHEHIKNFYIALEIEQNTTNLLDPYHCNQIKRDLQDELNYELASIDSLDDD